MKFIRSKLVPILVAITFLLFLTNDFGLIDIEKTAIIIALGIDSDPDGYEVTAQIAIPKATADSKNNEDAVVSGKGATIADAIDDIGVTTGWYPLLSFCNLIAIGDDTLDKNVMTFIDYFIRTDKIPDSSLLVATEGKAKKVLSVTTPLDSISAFAIEKILIKDLAKLDRIAFTDVKEFAKGYFSKSKSSYMPYVKTVKTDKAPSSDDKSSNDSNLSDDQKVFDCTSTLIFSNGVCKEVLNEEETLLFNMRKHSSTDTYLDFDGIEFEGETVSLTLSMNEVKKSYALNMKNSPIFKIDLIFNCQLEDVDKSDDIGDLLTTRDIPDEILDKAEEKIGTVLTGLFDKLKRVDCDLFSLQDELYKFHHSHYGEYEDGILQSATLEANVECRVQRNNRA